MNAIEHGFEGHLDELAISVIARLWRAENCSWPRLPAKLASDSGLLPSTSVLAYTGSLRISWRETEKIIYFVKMYGRTHSSCIGYAMLRRKARLSPSGVT